MRCFTQHLASRKELSNDLRLRNLELCTSLPKLKRHLKLRLCDIDTKMLRGTYVCFLFVKFVKLLTLNSPPELQVCTWHQHHPTSSKQTRHFSQDQAQALVIFCEMFVFCLKRHFDQFMGNLFKRFTSFTLSKTGFYVFSISQEDIVSFATYNLFLCENYFLTALLYLYLLCMSIRDSAWTFYICNYFQV